MFFFFLRILVCPMLFRGFIWGGSFPKIFFFPFSKAGGGGTGNFRLVLTERGPTRFRLEFKIPGGWGGPPAYLPRGQKNFFSKAPKKKKEKGVTGNFTALPPKTNPKAGSKKGKFRFFFFSILFVLNFTGKRGTTFGLWGQNWTGMVYFAPTQKTGLKFFLDFLFILN